MENKGIHTGQAFTVAAGVLAAVTQFMPDIQAAVPPKVAVWVLLATNILSAVLPKLVQPKSPER